MNITPQFLEKYNKPGPRYTSYPPATSFHDKFSQEDFIKSLISSNHISDLRPPTSDLKPNISIYLHIPFCPQRCYFCGCNTTEYKSEEIIKRYIDNLLKEIDSFSQYLDKSRKVTQIHWGGGTPNSINLDYIGSVMSRLRDNFSFSEKAEISIECNPAYLEFGHVERLAEMGINRISLGIQDFHPEVLKAINRLHSKHPLEKLTERIRQKNIKSINFDLVYGLPLQTIDMFRENIKRTIELSPDRIATFSYANVPWFNPLQRKLDKFHLPSPEEKLSMLILALEEFTANGYDSIGMDHFAKPADELAVAKRNRRLHRNFQGYCTKETTGQVYAFGSSSISQLWNAYSQNIKNLDGYMNKIEEKGFAIERGYLISDDEIIVREVINEIMCNGYLDFTDIASRFKITADELRKKLKYEPEKLNEFIDDSLMEIDGDIIRVNADGMFVIRNIAMCFDPFLKIEDSQFSKTV
jgi:oxygen-independent coproporphyrinogen-3 oxidase